MKAFIKNGKIPGSALATSLFVAGILLSGCDSTTSSNGGGSVPADNTVTATIGGVAKSGTAVAAKASGLLLISGSVYTGIDVANASTFNIYLKDTVAMTYNMAWNTSYGSGSYNGINNLYLQKKLGDTSLYWAVGPTAGKSGSATITITKITPYGGNALSPGKVQGTFSGTLVNIKDSTDKVTVSGGFNANRYN